MSNRDKENNRFSLTGAFKSVAGFVSTNKLQSSALLTSILLGTTALSAPMLTSTLGAGALLAGSIALLLQTGKTTIQNTLALGEKFHLSPLTLGLVIGSLNTVPEVMVSLGAAVRGALDLGVGNVVGSNIAHTMFILGATAAIAGIGKAKDLSWKFNTLVMAGTSALFGGQLIAGQFSPLLGGAMLGLGGYFLYHRLFSRRDKQHDHSHDRHEHEHDHDHHHYEGGPGTCLFHDHDDDESDALARAQPKWLNAGLAGAGMFGLTAAADLIVRSGVSFADQFNFAALGLGMDRGLSQAVIGAVIVAIGTALPEFMINIEAIRKKHSDLAVGNVLGCTIINTLVAGGVISLTGAAVPDAFNPATSMGLLNTSMFIGSAGLLTATLLTTKGAMSRWQGGAALGLYLAYLGGTMALNEGKAPDLHQHGAIQEVQMASNEVAKPPQRLMLP